MASIVGYISGYDGETLTIVAPFTNSWLLEKQQINECEITLSDGRSISPDQRKKIYATLNDISIWSGHVPEEIKEITKYAFLAETGGEEFSLSNCDMTTARLYLQWLIEFCIAQDIPCSDNLIERSPDIGRYIYACLANKRCCITGGKAELHHCDRVGMGRDRKEILHIGMRALPLTRAMHNEAHAIGQKTFEEKYHVFGIPLDADLCNIWKLKGATK